MSTTAETPDNPHPTLREAANAPRIGRARFIGNLLGLIAVGAVVLAGLMLAGLKEPFPGMAPPPTGPAPMMPHRWAIVAVATVVLLGLLDLAVRRRHDRGGNGVLVVLWVLLLLGGLYANALALLPAEILRLANLGLAGLSVLMMLPLLFLPTKRSDTRYGPAEPPEPHI